MTQHTLWDAIYKKQVERNNINLTDATEILYICTHIYKLDQSKTMKAEYKKYYDADTTGDYFLKH